MACCTVTVDYRGEIRHVNVPYYTTVGDALSRLGIPGHQRMRNKYSDVDQYDRLDSVTMELFEARNHRVNFDMDGTSDDEEFMNSFGPSLAMMTRSQRRIVAACPPTPKRPVRKLNVSGNKIWQF